MNARTRPLLMALFATTVSLTAQAQQPQTRPTTVQKWADPAEQFGRLFADVQLKAVFPDSKTFADCTPKASVQTILSAYELARMQPGFTLKTLCIAVFLRCPLLPHLVT